jgi:dimethylsulfone monooxygenase
MDQRTDQLREACNPLFGPARLKLGTFCTNLSGGCTMSSIDGLLKAEWPSTVALAQLAEEMEFEALVPVGRWKGFGGETDFNGAGFECYTWAAAIGALTKKAAVFATSHVPTVHPVMAAKQGTTIDHISNGRFTLNVVTGWFEPEIAMFGAPLMEHDQRYDAAIEWLEIIRQLWTRDEAFDFEGKFYHVKNATMRPKPIQKPHPVVMSAGASPRGKHFAAKYADVAFTNLEGHDFETLRSRVQSYRQLAREEYGREVQVWTNSYIFQGETEAEAKRFYQYCVHQKGDWAGVQNLVDIMGINSLSIPAATLQVLKEHFIAGWGGFPLVGTKEQIVDKLLMMSKAGFDGTLLSWARYEEDMRQFQAETLPLLRQAGLR